MKKTSFVLSMVLLVSAGLAGCNGAGDSGTRLGTDIGGQPVPIPDQPPVSSPPTGSVSPQIGPACASSDSNHICLGLKYVAYEDSSGTAVVSGAQALINLTQINKIWTQCNIGFQIDEYSAVDPSDSGLAFNTPTSAQLTSIRRAYASDSELVVVTTGAWSSTLGAGAANAWTAMPGSGDYGVVLEQPVGDFPNIVAHELGHYLNLDHYASTDNVMSAVIYTGSTALTTAQCSAARSAAQYYWTAMQR